jgi:hypothetical protein
MDGKLYELTEAGIFGGVTELRRRLDAEEAGTSSTDLRLLRVLEISSQLGDVTESVKDVLSADPGAGASAWSDVETAVVDVVVAALVALDTFTPDGRKIITEKLRRLLLADGGRSIPVSALT